MGKNSLNKRKRPPIINMPIVCPKPQPKPITHDFFLLSMAKGVTAAMWSGPVTTCCTLATKPVRKLINFNCFDKISKIKEFIDDYSKSVTFFIIVLL